MCLVVHPLSEHLDKGTRTNLLKSFRYRDTWISRSHGVFVIDLRFIRPIFHGYEDDAQCDGEMVVQTTHDWCLMWQAFVSLVFSRVAVQPNTNEAAHVCQSILGCSRCNMSHKVCWSVVKTLGDLNYAWLLHRTQVYILNTSWLILIVFSNIWVPWCSL
jgi:hypothetical protein